VTSGHRIRPLARVEYDALVEQGSLHGEMASPSSSSRGSSSPAARRVKLTPAPSGGCCGCSSRPSAPTKGSGNPIALSDLSEPEPDIAVFPPATYRGHHPTTATLLAEVSRSCVRWDLNGKALLYAGAGVPEYWVVDLVANRIVRHRDPAPDGYATVTAHHDGTLRPLHHPQVAIDVAALLA
jgi:Uma2 family endonuclease